MYSHLNTGLDKQHSPLCRFKLRCQPCYVGSKYIPCLHAEWGGGMLFWSRIYLRWDGVLVPVSWCCWRERETGSFYNLCVILWYTLIQGGWISVVFSLSIMEMFVHCWAGGLWVLVCGYLMHFPRYGNVIQMIARFDHFQLSDLLIYLYWTLKAGWINEQTPLYMQITCNIPHGRPLIRLSFFDFTQS